MQSQPSHSHNTATATALSSQHITFLSLSIHSRAFSGSHCAYDTKPFHHFLTIELYCRLVLLSFLLPGCCPFVLLAFEFRVFTPVASISAIVTSDGNGPDLSAHNKASHSHAGPSQSTHLRAWLRCALSWWPALTLVAAANAQAVTQERQILRSLLGRHLVRAGVFELHSLF